MSNLPVIAAPAARYLDPQYLRQRLSPLSEEDRTELREFLTTCARRNYSPDTLYGHVTAWVVFLRSVPNASVYHVTARAIEAFIEHQQDQKKHPSSINGYLSCLFAFYRYLLEQGKVTRNPVLRRHRLQVPDALPRAMSPSEYQRFFAPMTSTRDRALFLLLLRSGLRIGELVVATLDDLRLEQNELTIPLGRKNRRGRIIYFSDDARTALEAYGKERPIVATRALFVSNRRRPIAKRSITHRFHRYARAAGLPPHYSTHCLRHTFATELLNAGTDLVTIQYLLGHDEIRVTQRYARLTDQTKRRSYFDAMARLQPTNHEEEDHVA